MPIILAGLLSACQGPDSASVSDEKIEADSGDVRPLPTRSVGSAVVPDFERLGPEDFSERLDQAIARADQTIDQIAELGGPPDRDNTLLALESAEREVSELAALLNGLRQVHGGAEWLEAQATLSPRLAEHASRLRSHQGLFARLSQLRDEHPDQWTQAERRLLDQTLQSMRHAGAGLEPTARQRLANIERQLAELANLFMLNLERETQRFDLHLTDPAQLQGLPPGLIEQAARDARDRGHAAGWSFTLNAHSLFPFLRFSEDRELRQTLYQAWQRRAGGMRYGQPRDNPELIRRMVSLRAERARLLGYPNHLELTLADSSAGRSERIERMLDELEQAARPRAAQDLADIRSAMAAEGIDDEPRPWDWWHFRHRLASTDQPVQAPAPSASLVQVRNGLFDLAASLWDLEFRSTPDLPGWHQDVETYSVYDQDQRLLGWLYLDLYHRQGKSGGAWISQYPGHERESGRELPLVAMVTNLAPRTSGEPRPLGHDEIETLLHEFGHALHVLLSTASPAALAGIQVPGDFVEFPAMLFERFANQPKWLDGLVLDVQGLAATSAGPAQPEAARLAGLETLEQIAATRIDLALHRISNGETPRIETLETGVASAMALPPLLSPRHRFDGYAALFAGNRAGQDYRSLWAELLAADAFSQFVAAGVLDQATAERFRIEILARGNSRDPMQSFEAFMGRPPQSRALIEERGLD